MTVWHGRVEDEALLTGRGKFGDDVRPEGALAAVFVRSPFARARITSIDVEAAVAAPGPDEEPPLQCSMFQGVRQAPVWLA